MIECIPSTHALVNLDRKFRELCICKLLQMSCQMPSVIKNYKATFTYSKCAEESLGSPEGYCWCKSGSANIKG